MPYRLPKTPHLLLSARNLTLRSSSLLLPAIALSSGILMGLAPAPLNAYPLAWVALAPLWVMVLGGDGQWAMGNGQWAMGNGSQKSGEQETGFKIQNSKFKTQNSSLHPTPHSPLPTPSPLVLAFLWGVGYHGLALSWIWGLHPLTWMGIPWLGSVAIALFCWAFITFWGAALVVIWAWGMRKLEGEGRRQKAEGRGQEAEGGRRRGDTETRRRGDTENSKFKIQNSKLKTPPLPSHSSLLTPHSSPHPPLPSATRILLGAALWCSLEWLWSLGTLNWTSLSYTQSSGNLLILHLGQLSGPLTVTAAIVAVNGLLAEAFIHWQGQGRQRAEGRGQKVEADTEAQEYGDAGNSKLKTQNSKLKTQNSSPLSLLSTAVIFLIALHLIGFGFYSRPLVQTAETELRVGVIQGNVPTRIKLFSEGLRRAEAAYTQGYEKLAEQGVKAVLTPEGALPYLWNKPNSTSSPFYQAVLRKRVVAWLGTFTAQKGGIARSLLTLIGDGQTFSFYNKIKLVPLGEYTPFQKVLGGIVGRLSPVSEDGVPGTLNQRLNTPFGRAIASICYDSAFSEVFRTQAAAGGQFILTASNLDPYSEVLMAQHQAQDLMRAIETDRWAVRATNTGYSGIINPHGKIIWRSQPKTYEVHADTIYRRQTQTL